MKANKTYHPELSNGRWHTMTIAEQLGNVGSEYERALSWKERGEVAEKGMALSGRRRRSTKAHETTRTDGFVSCRFVLFRGSFVVFQQPRVKL